MSLRGLRAAPGRSALTVLGIMLGVAMVFAIEVVNTSVLGAFRDSLAGVAGNTRLMVGSGVGVAEEALETVRGVPGVAAAVPIIEASVGDVRGQRQLAVLALDTLSDPTARGYDVMAKDARIDDELEFLNDPQGVLVTPEYARRMGVAAGDRLMLDTVMGRRAFTVHGTITPQGPATAYGGDVLLMDVYAAQLAFDRGRRFDRIDVIPKPTADVAKLARALERALGHKTKVTLPERRSAEAERLLGGFRLALSLASVVALFVGAFIVYNSLAIAVARRRREIGVLRALGTSRAQLLALFVGEGLLMGVLGSVLGLCFGAALGRAALGAAAATVSALYVPMKVQAAVFAWSDVCAALALGIGASLVAALLPAYRAAVVDPVRALGASLDTADIAGGSPSAPALAAASLLALAGLVAALAHRFERVALAYAVAGLLSLAGACLAPLLSAGVGRVAQRYARRVGPSVTLGAVGFARNKGRSAVATAALGMALANIVNVDALIDSMKGTTDAWLSRSFRADVFVFAGTDVQAKFDHPLPDSLRSELRSLDQVEFVQAFRMVRHGFRDQPFYLMSEDLEGYRRYNALPVVAGDLASALSELDAGTALAASEAFARNFAIGVGDVVTLDTPEGRRRFRIALVYTDYRADIGILFTSRATYTRIWHDTQVDLYSVYLARNAPLERARSEISRRWGARYGLLALGNAQYRDQLLSLVDRSMGLSRAIELVAIVVAGLGIINALLVSVLDRRREIGMLKAIGAERFQLNRMVLTEALLIACTAALLGALLGMGLSAYMVLEALRIQIGWHLTLRFSGLVLCETFLLALPVALLSAFWPMRWTSRLPIVEALQYE
ncbi:MAG: FtsX-like permease family protein [Polyangiales bacterium]